MKLLFWFVDNCSAQEGPDTSNKFKEYGIKSNSDFKKLKSKIIDAVGLKQEITYKACSNGIEMELLINEIEKAYSSRRKPIIFFTICGFHIKISFSFRHDCRSYRPDYICFKRRQNSLIF